MTNQQVKLAPHVPRTYNSDRFPNPLRTQQRRGPNIASRRVSNTTCAHRPGQFSLRNRSHSARLAIFCSACSSFKPSVCESPAAFQQPPRRFGDRAAISRTSPDCPDCSDHIDMPLLTRPQAHLHRYRDLSKTAGKESSATSLLSWPSSGATIRPSASHHYCPFVSQVCLWNLCHSPKPPSQGLGCEL